MYPQTAGQSGPRYFFCLLLEITRFYFSGAMEQSRCTSARISPVKGLCSGTTFNFKICTGDPSWFSFTKNDLSIEIRQQTKELEFYSWLNCSVEVTEACRRFLPSTSVIPTLTLTPLSCTISSFKSLLRFSFHSNKHIAYVDYSLTGIKVPEMSREDDTTSL
jgi:hypothetical protein